MNHLLYLALTSLMAPAAASAEEAHTIIIKESSKGSIIQVEDSLEEDFHFAIEDSTGKTVVENSGRNIRHDRSNRLD